MYDRNKYLELVKECEKSILKYDGLKKIAIERNDTVSHVRWSIASKDASNQMHYYQSKL